MAAVPARSPSAAHPAATAKTAQSNARATTFRRKRAQGESVVPAGPWRVTARIEGRIEWSFKSAMTRFSVE